MAIFKPPHSLNKLRRKLAVTCVIDCTVDECYRAKVADDFSGISAFLDIEKRWVWWLKKNYRARFGFNRDELFVSCKSGVGIWKRTLEEVRA